MKLGLLLSGEFGDLMLRDLASRYEITAVFTDAKSIKIQEFCKVNGLPLFVGNPRNGRSKEFLSTHICDVLISINYLFIVEEDIINWPLILAFNIHGSLLPKYRGRTPHVWSIINDEKLAGLTAHIITSEMDAGDILGQVEVLIDEDDSGYTLLQKYHAICPGLVCKVIESIQSQTINRIKQNHQLATYFSKREPADGLINWNWQRRRILNWVRALAPPYPGAFTFLNGQKIIVVGAMESNVGFRDTLPNGTVLGLTDDKVIVKVPNGAISLSLLDETLISSINLGVCFAYE